MPQPKTLRFHLHTGSVEHVDFVLGLAGINEIVQVGEHKVTRIIFNTEATKKLRDALNEIYGA